jgi:hypothetical protein
MTISTTQENYLPKEKNNPERTVVPINKVKAWEAIGYRAIGNAIRHSGQEDGVFWKEVVCSSPKENPREAIQPAKSEATVMSLIGETQMLTQMILARLNVCLAAANQPEATSQEIDCHDLYLVLDDHKQHLKHLAKVISHLEFKYIENHYDRANEELKPL